jgi:predicted membrane channel-forming protein YqfA (hemolysin III family)
MDHLMTPSWRKPAGVLAIIALIALWCVLIASFSNALARLPGWAQLLVYLVTGIVWIAPMKPLLRWMETGRWRG